MEHVLLEKLMFV